MISSINSVNKIIFTDWAFITCCFLTTTSAFWLVFSASADQMSCLLENLWFLLRKAQVLHLIYALYISQVCMK